MNAFAHFVELAAIHERGMNGRFGRWGGLRLGFGASRVPVILQTEGAECGLACLAMVAAAHGHRSDLPTLRQRFSLSLKGLNLLDLVRMAESLNLHARALRAEIEDLAPAGAPLHPALGHEPLRGAGRRQPRRRDDPRPGAWPAPAEAGAGVAPLHRRGAGADAGGRLRAARREAACLAAPDARPHHRAEALAGADLRAGAGARSLHAAQPFPDAVGGRRRAGQRRPRPAGHAGHRLRPAGADPGRHRGDPLVGGAGAVGHAQPAVAGQRVRAPDAPAGGVVREAPHRRHLVALLGRAADPEDADHELHRGRARRPAGGADAGDDVRLQRHADGGGAGRGGRLCAAALGLLQAAARRHRRGAGARVEEVEPLPRVAARRAGDQAVQRAGRPAIALHQPGGGHDERRPGHAQAGVAVRGAAPAAVRAGARGGGLDRRAAGAGPASSRSACCSPSSPTRSSSRSASAR